MGDGYDEYVSDPAHPVPYRQRPIQATYGPGSKWRDWLVEDQRFVKDRADVLTWESAVLEEDVTIAGEVRACLFASTTGTDADWIVKLIDVFPDDATQPPASGKEPEPIGGYQLTVVDEIFRARFRDGFERAQPVPAGQVLEYRFALHQADHVFGKGHRIMVQVQSTWFPLFDRNPQRFVGNIFAARAEDYVAATHRIHRSAGAPSSIVLPLVDK